jgi:hypothetical protein
MPFAGGTLVFSAKASSPALRSEFAPGALVRVSVLSARADGTAHVRVGERVLVAASFSDHLPGSSFDARVRFSDGAMLLVPEPSSGSASPSTVFSSLGIPETPVSSFLVSFFRVTGLKLDSRLLVDILKISSRFHGKEARAAEAAALLAERGISIDDESVSRMIDLLEGKTGYAGSGNPGKDGTDESDRRSTAEENSSDADSSIEDSSISYTGRKYTALDDITGTDGLAGDGNGHPCPERERDFCAFFNHKRGHELHWVVLPFAKSFEGRLCTGSIRFLLDTVSGGTAETRVTFLDGIHSWEFSVKGDACSFTAKPPFSTVAFDKFVVYLMRQTASFRFSEVSWHEPDHSSGSKGSGVDLEM